MGLKIDGKDISELSLDQIGATLQQIAEELTAREAVGVAISVRSAGDFIRKRAETGAQGWRVR